MVQWSRDKLYILELSEVFKVSAATLWCAFQEGLHLLLWTCEGEIHMPDAEELEEIDEILLERNDTYFVVERDGAYFPARFVVDGSDVKIPFTPEWGNKL